MRRLSFMFGLVLIVSVAVLFGGLSLHASTASTSTVTGTVSGKSGATVRNGKVEVEVVSTKERFATATGREGGYVFPSVKRGNYNVIMSGKGFRQTLISAVKV